MIWVVIKAYFKSIKNKKLPDIVGVHHSGNPDEIERLCVKAGRLLPYRKVSGKLFEIFIPHHPAVYSPGNEMNREHGYTVHDLLVYMIERGKKEYSPALHTLKQWPEWEQMFDLYDPEPHISGWCINTHGPSFRHMTKNVINRFDGMFSWIKRAQHLSRFMKLTKLPIIITEAGVGQNSDLTARDIRFNYYIHEAIIGDRLRAFLVYDSALISYNKGFEVL